MVFVCLKKIARTSKNKENVIFQKPLYICLTHLYHLNLDFKKLKSEQ